MKLINEIRLDGRNVRRKNIWKSKNTGMAIAVIEAKTWIKRKGMKGERGEKREEKNRIGKVPETNFVFVGKSQIHFARPGLYFIY